MNVCPRLLSEGVCTVVLGGDLEWGSGWFSREEAER